MKSSITIAVVLAACTASATAGDLQTELMAMEKAGWQAWANHDDSVVRKNSAADHVQIIAGAGRSAGIEAVAKDTAGHTCKNTSFDLHDPSLRQLTPDVVILSYEATQVTECNGKPMPAKVLATSVYTRTDGAWKARNYQETSLE